MKAAGCARAGGIIFLLLTACQTTPSDQSPGKVHMRGKGIAKYHLYGDVNKCQTAFGLDPEAFDSMVTAVSTKIHAEFPAMTKVGKRDGPYDPRARCVWVRSFATGKAIVVRAIDKCCVRGNLGDSKSHQLDLAKEAFEKLAPLAKGNLSIEWALVDCPEALQVKDDSAVCDDNFYYSQR